MMTLKPNLTKRFFASFIDYFIVLALTYFYIDYFGTPNDEGGKSVENLMTLPIIILWFLYFVVIESIYGGTLSHLAFDLRVLGINGQRIEFLQALQRHLLDPIDFFLLGLSAFISIKNSDKHQRIGDMWAKTAVVDIKDPEQFVIKENA